MKRVSYMSTFARPLARSEIDALGTQSAQRNAGDQITGVLLTLGNVFFQIIEGPTDPVDALYERVLADDRHTEILCLSNDEDAAVRLFPEWSMRVLDLDDVTGDIAVPLKLLLARVSETNTIVGRFTQPAVSAILARGDNPLEMPLQKTERLVLFCDMVSFSAISARLPIEQVSELVATYLEACSTIIFEAGGEVTKFLGDGIMAYFAVDQVDQALEACLACQRALALIRAHAVPDSALRVLYAGFGLAMGPVVEGPMGSSVKMDYTIIGEPVNTAANLEAMTRRLDVPVLMAPEVAAAAGSHWSIEPMSEEDVGRNEQMPVFALDIGPDRPVDLRGAVADFLDKVATHDSPSAS